MRLLIIVPQVMSKLQLDISVIIKLVLNLMTLLFVFMPEWVYSVVAVAFLTGIIIFFVQKRKNDEWSGILLKKKHTPGDMETNETWKLVFKTDEGKKKRYQVNLKVWDDWKEGAKSKKEKGEYLPKKA